MVELIDTLFPKAQSESSGDLAEVDIGHAVQLGAILDFVDAIPAHLITLEPSEYAEYCIALAAIRFYLRKWGNGDTRSQILPFVIPGVRRASMIGLLRDALAKCPDELPNPETATLGFIDDVL
ncbi:MAG TPA: hypothetical protein VMT22_19765, partial [Terriglobales bacterium]|nr:hypothetical protein [Terriglobales bacterium]